MLKIKFVTDTGERWSSGIVCQNVMKFLNPAEFECHFQGFQIHWFQPSDAKFDIVFLQCCNKLQGSQIKKLRKIRDHLKIQTRLTCGVRGKLSLKQGLKFFKFFDAIECANKQFLAEVKKINSNVYLGRSGVDTEMFKPLDIDKPEEFTIGFAGSMYRPVKNFSVIQKLGYPVKIASKQSRANSALKMGDYGIEVYRNPYECPNYYPYYKMPVFHNSYSIYVCASKSEGGPNPVLEAAASGKAIVSTNVAWMPELLDAEWIVNGDPDKDPEVFKEMKQKVDRLAADLALRRKVGERNRRVAIEKWDWRIIIKEWERFYKAAWETRLA